MNTFEEHLNKALILDEKLLENKYGSSSSDSEIFSESYSDELKVFNEFNQKEVFRCLRDECCTDNMWHNKKLWNEFYAQHPFVTCLDDEMLDALINTEPENLIMMIKDNFYFHIHNLKNNLLLIIRYYDEYSIFYYTLYLEDPQIEQRCGHKLHRDLKEVSNLFFEKTFQLIWSIEKWGLFCRWFFYLIGKVGMECRIELHTDFVEVGFYHFFFSIYDSYGYKYLIFEAYDENHDVRYEIEFKDSDPYYKECFMHFYQVNAAFNKAMKNLGLFNFTFPTISPVAKRPLRKLKVKRKMIRKY